MRASQWFLSTLREIPSDAEIVSHQLMLRAGLIRKLSSGLYTWLPLGLKVLRHVERIVREEMNHALAIEVLMPAIQPAELWQETGRWETFGGQLLTMTDSNDRKYCYGPTHEEVITDLMRSELKSYKQLPVNFYQIQTKFRDEIRPRFGVMRAREFIMKDAYSFHTTKDSLNDTYQLMYQTYGRILDRLGLQYRVVEADTGAIGGEASHEFQVLAQAGEDIIFYSDQSNYAANIEQARALLPEKIVSATDAPLTQVATPNQKTIPDVAQFLNLGPELLVKTLIVQGQNTPLVALVIRGDDELNEVKAAKHPLIKSPLAFSDTATVMRLLNKPPGFLGPVALDIPVIVDYVAHHMPSFICGANQVDTHLINANWQRDVNIADVCDLRNVKVGDRSPDGQGLLDCCRGIEVGHIFQLGNKYAEAMKAQVVNEQGMLQTVLMGCYGLGISRIVAAAVEQHHDSRGIIWPEAIAPFNLVLIPINAHRVPEINTCAYSLYQLLQDQGMEVLLDDRQERPGVLFADCDLMGIPHRLVISERLLAQGMVEYKARNSDQVTTLAISDVASFFAPAARPSL